jgi:DNA repair protein RadC
VPQALQAIPKAAQFSDIASYRKHLHETLPFNAVATRKRNASYLIGRFFPCEHLHPDLVAFAAAAEGHRALGDVLFYLTCRTEKMVAIVAESLICPSLADGGLPRTRIQDFIQAHFPQFKNANDLSSAIVRTYTGFGVATASRTRMNVSQRQGHLAAFAYIMHLEFPETGMYSFDKLLDGPMHKWLLWDRKWIAEQLYMLRHFKLLSKVSEIDNIRQFTTKYSLSEAVEHILPLLKEEQP